MVEKEKVPVDAPDDLGRTPFYMACKYVLRLECSLKTLILTDHGGQVQEVEHSKASGTARSEHPSARYERAKDPRSGDVLGPLLPLAFPSPTTKQK